MRRGGGSPNILRMHVTAKSLAVLPHVDAALSYLAPTTDRRPIRYAGRLAQEPPPDAATYERCRVQIRDARPIADVVSLDEEGFQLVPHRTAVGDFWNDQAVRRLYYPEMEALIADLAGASWAFVFDHTLRRRVFGLPDRTPGAPRQPAMEVQVGYTELSAPKRVRELTGQAAASLLGRRFAIVSAWRPIRGPLHDAPLALCDARSTAPHDLVATDLIGRARVDEAYSVTWNPHHRWLYFPGMRPDEVLLFKGYDSSADDVARFVPHAAFEDPSAPADRLIQESIEVTALVFFR